MPKLRKTRGRKQRRMRAAMPRSRRGNGDWNGDLGLTGIGFRPTQARGPRVATVQHRQMPLGATPHFQRGMLYYENALTITGTTGAIGNYFFRANGVFDPNASGTGHQPMGFDQMMLLFEQWYVLRAHIRVRFMNTTAGLVVAGVALAPDMTSVAVDNAQEQGLLKTVVLENKGVQGDVREINLAIDNPRYMGVKRQAYISSALYQGTSGNDPTELDYFKLFIYNYDGASTATVTFDVTISYDVYFNEPRQLGLSMDKRMEDIRRSFKNRFDPKPKPEVLDTLEELRKLLRNAAISDEEKKLPPAMPADQLAMLPEDKETWVHLIEYLREHPLKCERPSTGPCK